MTKSDGTEAADGVLATSLSARAMALRPTPYLDDLNPAQREAVEALEGPVLMLAGAGTGKTKALTSRIAHILNTGAARPNEILAVTFTNKAAREMKTRVQQLLGRTVEGMTWLGTFHAICAKLLRRHAEIVGLKPNYSILDTDDQTRLLKQIIVAENIDEKKFPARLLSHLIDGWKNRALTPEKIPVAESAAFNHRGVELYDLYQKRLIKLNAVDFGDLLLHMLTILQESGDVLKNYQQRFRYILVDEYQDTNIAQYLWLRLLSGDHKNICCVGDDDQSIYGWRGAEVDNILRFERDFPGAKVVRLEQNYRSTPHILAVASGLIAANRGRLGKTLFTEVGDGEKVRLASHWEGEDEARWIGGEIEAMQVGTRGQRAFDLDEIAILVRATRQMRAFEDRFLTIGLPYRVIGGPRFYERQEIRDALAYFRVACSPTDDLAFERIVNTPKRGVGDKAHQTIQLSARAGGGLSLLEGARIAAASGQLTGKAGTTVLALVRQFERWHQIALSPSCSHVDLAEDILDGSGYTEMWNLAKTPDAPGRLENLKELVKGLEQFENLQGFLEHIALVMDNDSESTEPKVSIMTLHSAKGLEFPAIFLPGWEDGLFPHQLSLDENGIRGLEEERRLAYVGITRAEELCTVSFAQNRLVYGQWQATIPSRFIDELPPNHVEVLAAPGRGNDGYGWSDSAGTGIIEEQAARADVYNSPGWKRLQAHKGSRPMASGRETGRIAVDLEATSVFSCGDRVFHDKFGYGYVMDIMGEKLDIEFEKAGSKKVVARFVVPAERAGDLTT